MLSPPVMHFLCHTFQQHQISLTEFLITLLIDPNIQQQGTPVTSVFTDLVTNVQELLAALWRNPASSSVMKSWCHTMMKGHYEQAVKKLTRRENGWHFGAIHTSEEQLRDFRIQDMAAGVREVAPELWDLVGFLLAGNHMEIEAPREDAVEMDMVDEEEEYWAALEGHDDALNTPGAQIKKNSRGPLQRRLALKKIVCHR